MLFDVVAMTQADFDARIAQLIEIENATPPPAPSGAPVLHLVAKDIAFDKTELQVPADTPFVIELRNDDIPSVTHDVDIRQSDGTTVVQDQPTIPGGDTAQYNYEPLAAGTYTFICSIHPIPAMTGTLTVQ
jgi:plastocyanin